MAGKLEVHTKSGAVIECLSFSEKKYGLELYNDGTVGYVPFDNLQYIQSTEE